MQQTQLVEATDGTKLIQVFTRSTSASFLFLLAERSVLIQPTPSDFEFARRRFDHSPTDTHKWPDHSHVFTCPICDVSRETSGVGIFEVIQGFPEHSPFRVSAARVMGRLLCETCYDGLKRNIVCRNICASS